jgi:osmotically-inducible protein OsmY
MNTHHMTLLAFATVCSLGLVACSQSQSAESDLGWDVSAADDTAKISAADADASTTVKIKNAIDIEPGLEKFQITVTTINRVVDLTGTVDTAEDRDKAQQVAERFSGVSMVQNRIVVMPG